MKQRYISAMIITFVAIIAIFPTSHIRFRQDLVKELDCTKILGEGESLQAIWTNMRDDTKIEVNIMSKEDIQVLLIGWNNDSDTYYNLAQKVHNVQHTRYYPSYNVTVWNPTKMRNGSSARMSRSIKAHHVYVIQELLPWWMH